ncbi:hypothetical protein [Ammoniphilus sp. 3BR4]|uniref:hypothetical protein n=1 Tax=Ammoniphilus sp. 3BR4 TaxID=3158265 RepID=UPI003467A2D5
MIFMHLSRKFFLRLVVYVCIFTVLVGGVAAFGFVESQKDFYGAVRQEMIPSLQGIEIP